MLPDTFMLYDDEEHVVKLNFFSDGHWALLLYRKSAEGGFLGIGRKIVERYVGGWSPGEEHRGPPSEEHWKGLGSWLEMFEADSKYWQICKRLPDLIERLTRLFSDAREVLGYKKAN